LQCSSRFKYGGFCLKGKDWVVAAVLQLLQGLPVMKRIYDGH
jgi:hypothetical protein